ncbi:TetR/AcrR family transcriptional regulator [filamentous cyanobacterium LEGE 11480]|uniref:TetR/AcrR family transcriptional regulator n=1 Tax=Romeriopsis navalis LEGE 11480 TaxID=2777977 RepID=A0A928VHF9_9CYAN|nr:TetR/AcrR family transcriptional regulator [Romeriopsis navalis]MBE9028686.1 TetR/AcrR family transcriptional regulator [Romeriopsis navalis LEGE 11480]
MQTLDETKRTAILEAATNRFTRYGVRKTTMQEIAQDVGIAVGTLYLYFKNKKTIIIAVAETFTQSETATDIAKSRKRADRLLKAFLLSRFAVIEAARNSGDHAAELTLAVLKLKPEFKQTQDQRFRATVYQILQKGIDQGIFEINHLEQDLTVFLYSIGYFFPMPTSEQYHVPEADKLAMVIDWFIQKWQP